MFNSLRGIQVLAMAMGMGLAVGPVQAQMPGTVKVKSIAFGSADVVGGATAMLTLVPDGAAAASPKFRVVSGLIPVKWTAGAQALKDPPSKVTVLRAGGPPRITIQTRHVSKDTTVTCTAQTASGGDASATLTLRPTFDKMELNPSHIKAGGKTKLVYSLKSTTCTDWVVDLEYAGKTKTINQPSSSKGFTLDIEIPRTYNGPPQWTFTAHLHCSDGMHTATAHLNIDK